MKPQAIAAEWIEHARYRQLIDIDWKTYEYVHNSSENMVVATMKNYNLFRTIFCSINRLLDSIHTQKQI